MGADRHGEILDGDGEAAEAAVVVALAEEDGDPGTILHHRILGRNRRVQGLLGVPDFGVVWREVLRRDTWRGIGIGMMRGEGMIVDGGAILGVLGRPVLARRRPRLGDHPRAAGVHRGMRALDSDLLDVDRLNKSTRDKLDVSFRRCLLCQPRLDKSSVNIPTLCIQSSGITKAFRHLFNNVEKFIQVSNVAPNSATLAGLRRSLDL